MDDTEPKVVIALCSAWLVIQVLILGALVTAEIRSLVSESSAPCECRQANAHP